jgi:phosphate transport system substrate-binding protein
MKAHKLNRSVLVIATLLAAACSRETKPADGEKPEGAEKKDTPAAVEKKAERRVLQNKGSDTLVNVAQAWAEEYKEVDPNTAIAVSGGGSGTGIAALLNNTVDLANSSRSIKDKEIKLAEEKGIHPKEHIVGYDALAVFLHPGNPIKELTIAQLKDIYGEGGKIDKWSQLNVKVPGCDSDEIVRVSRQNNSGTYVYFGEAILGENGEYKLGSRDMHGSKDVVDLVQKTPCAIGYSGLAYATAEVAMPCVKKDDAAPCIAPAVESATDGSYPVARPLFMYTNGEPKGETKKYLDWIRSDVGQCIILAKGYAPAGKVNCK